MRWFSYVCHMVSFIINSCRSFGVLGELRSKNSTAFYETTFGELSGGYSVRVCVRARVRFEYMRKAEDHKRDE